VPADEAALRLGALRTEGLFRETNERLSHAYAAQGDGTDAYICECFDRGCTDEVLLTTTEYSDVRAHPTRFAVLTGHHSKRFERVISVTAAFTVVEKPLSL
jgi:hypothetical protein